LNHALPCALALTALSLPLAACGGSGGDAATAADSAADRDAARVRLEQCLRKEGVDLPEPGQAASQRRPGAGDRDKVRAALEGPCKKYQQEAFGDVSAEDRQEMRDRMVKFSACMRKQGVDIPDMRPGEAGGPPRRVNLNSPRARKATEKCRDLLPTRPGGQGGGQGGGPGIQIGPPPGGSE